MLTQNSSVKNAKISSISEYLQCGIGYSENIICITSFYVHKYYIGYDLSLFLLPLPRPLSIFLSDVCV